MKIPKSRTSDSIFGQPNVHLVSEDSCTSTLKDYIISDAFSAFHLGQFDAKVWDAAADA